MGSLAFVVFLGLFVKYAWDQNWVGPTGRVLAGALTGVALVALGVRLLGREYRPLGQGLAATGVAGLYVSAFASHGFYDLVPSQVAGLFMVAITANAVLLAVRLDTRLLAALAWIGGYLTPVLLSTGQDRAGALYLYLLLLDTGALALDRKKPWPETVPLALLGTLVLYGGWYARFFAPERFAIAAFGIVLFTTLFVLGMAQKKRTVELAAVLVLAAAGLAFLAEAGRPDIVMFLSLGLAVAGLRLGPASSPWAFPVVALMAIVFPLLAWVVRPGPLDFPLAAAWTLAGVLLLTRATIVGAKAPPVAYEGLALAVGGVLLAGLVSTSSEARPASAALVAFSALCVLARPRVVFAELLGVVTVALGVFRWLDLYFDPDHPVGGWMLLLPASAVLIGSLVARGLVLQRPFAPIDLVSHLGAASLLWGGTYFVLDRSAPSLLGPAAALLALLYLGLGLAGRRLVQHDPRQVRGLLGLAAGFLTLAIPVQLGLHGITLGWALEGVLLLWLGLRYASPILRAGGYSVLGLALLRLVGFHLPLHGDAPFRPVLNATFGTWFAVLGAVATAVFVTRSARQAGQRLDRVVAPVLSVAAILLLFGLLTGEIQHVFAQQEAVAYRTGDQASVAEAQRRGGLAVSFLWTVFATGLLASGLGFRNRPLFYAAYGLFAVTAGKVVLWDLSTFSMPYRMLAFLGLALLLMAGAYLNLRFRERLLPRPAAP